jgi:hypothetical protein
MAYQLNFITNSLLEDVTYDSNGQSWYFKFSDGISVSASGFWRLLEKKKIVLVSSDHGHQFGLPKPLDLSKEIKNRLTNKKLLKIQVKEDSADLALIFSDQFEIEIFISSSGYESYDFSLNEKRYIGLGSGDIAIIDIV